MTLPARCAASLRHLLIAAAGVLLLAGCGGGGGGADAATVPATGTGTPPVAVPDADVRVLMMGNSHTTVADLPGDLAALLRAGLPGRRVSVVVAPGSMFLDERSTDGPSLALLRAQPWTAVVLQAQKYSSSGAFSHPTDGAEQLVQAARAQRALPVLFPEWPRLGVDETLRIYALHVGIAQARPACVAPVGQAWDLALQRHPTLRLHADDGNHADRPGAYLAALVLYAAITGASPRGLPDQPNGLDPAVQARLRAAAADTLQAVPARRHCPADPPL